MLNLKTSVQLQIIKEEFFAFSWNHDSIEVSDKAAVDLGQPESSSSGTIRGLESRPVSIAEQVTSTSCASSKNIIDKIMWSYLTSMLWGLLN